MSQSASECAAALRGNAVAISEAMLAALPPWGDVARTHSDLLMFVDAAAAAVELGCSSVIDRQLAWQKVRTLALGGEPGAVTALPVALRAAAAPFVDSGQEELVRILLDAEVFVRHAPSTNESCLDPDEPLHEAATAFLLAVLGGQRVDARAIALRVADPAAMLSHVLAPVQRELGRLWQVGRLEPAMEHIATRIVQETLHVIERAALRPSTSAPMIALVRLAADQHSLGQEFLALQLRVEGLRTRVVTVGDEEHGSIGIERVVELQPVAVAFSLSPLSLAAAAAGAIAALRRALPSCPILAGGAALHDLPQLATQLGADGGGTNAADAAARLAALVS